MCGIFGFVGAKQSVKVLLSGLENLEYRGYDSAGIAFIESFNNKRNIKKNNQGVNNFYLDKNLNTNFYYKNNKHLTNINKNNKTTKKIKIIKESGKIEDLKKIVSTRSKTTTGIAHTRWATHGLATKENAHPHLSYNKNFAVVHNGIIENYQSLQEKFLPDIKLTSQTDSEIIAHLFEKFFSRKSFGAGGNFANAKNKILSVLRKVCNLLQGSFAFAVISPFFPNKIFLAKKQSPLIVGRSEESLFFSSDVNTLGLFCEDFLIMQDNQIAVLSVKKFHSGELKQKKQIELFDFALNPLLKKFFKAKKSHTRKKGQTCFMKEEINFSPVAIEQTASIFERQVREIPANFWQGLNVIYLIGCGTAFHSCLAGETYLKQFFQLPIISQVASEFVISSPLITGRTMCIFVSQSGETADTLKAMRHAKEGGARVLSITNNSDSTLAFESQYVLTLDAGWERAVASTKAYVCQIEMFYLLSLHLQKKLKTGLQKIKLLSQEMIRNDFWDWAKFISKKILEFEKIIFIGRGVEYITALEASLKFKEITYINSIAIPSGELKHGTLALVDEKTLVFALLTESELLAQNSNSIKEITARGGRVVVVSQHKQALQTYENENQESGNTANATFENLLLPIIPQELMPLLAIIPFQALACQTSLVLNHNPDMPRNLSKSVTVD